MVTLDSGKSSLEWKCGFRQKAATRAGFMVPIHDSIVMKAFHEPFPLTLPSPHPLHRLRCTRMGRGCPTCPPKLGAKAEGRVKGSHRFMVPMHAKNRMGAFPEPPFVAASLASAADSSPGKWRRPGRDARSDRNGSTLSNYIRQRQVFSEVEVRLSPESRYESGVHCPNASAMADEGFP